MGTKSKKCQNQWVWPNKKSWIPITMSYLVGGLVAIFEIFPWLLGCESIIPIESYVSEGWPNHQPDTIYSWSLSHACFFTKFFMWHWSHHWRQFGWPWHLASEGCRLARILEDGVAVTVGGWCNTWESTDLLMLIWTSAENLSFYIDRNGWNGRRVELWPGNDGNGVHCWHDDAELQGHTTVYRCYAGQDCHLALQSTDSYVECWMILLLTFLVPVCFLWRDLGNAQLDTFPYVQPCCRTVPSAASLQLSPTLPSNVASKLWMFFVKSLKWYTPIAYLWTLAMTYVQRMNSSSIPCFFSQD